MMRSFIDVLGSCQKLNGYLGGNLCLILIADLFFARICIIITKSSAISPQ